MGGDEADKDYDELARMTTFVRMMIMMTRRRKRRVSMFWDSTLKPSTVFRLSIHASSSPSLYVACWLSFSFYSSTAAVRCSCFA